MKPCLEIIELDKYVNYYTGFWNPGYFLDKYKKVKGHKSRKAMHTFNDFPCDHLHYFICEKNDSTPLLSWEQCSKMLHSQQNITGSGKTASPRLNNLSKTVTIADNHKDTKILANKEQHGDINNAIFPDSNGRNMEIKKYKTKNNKRKRTELIDLSPNNNFEASSVNITN